MKNTELFTLYLNSAACASAAADALREAAAATVIAHTAEHCRVDEKFFEILKQESKNFADASRIIVTRGADCHKVVADLSFCGSESQKLEKLLRFIQVIHTAEMWYEDRCGQSFGGDQFEGFCWKGPDNEFFFCGMPVPVESQPGDWDYEESQAVVPANVTKKGTSRK